MISKYIDAVKYSKEFSLFIHVSWLHLFDSLDRDCVDSDLKDIFDCLGFFGGKNH